MQKKITNLQYLFLIGGVIRLLIICLPFDYLFARWGSDDLYYYSQIASYFNQTGTFTFDGIEPTNGFQPLFIFSLIPFGTFMQNNVQISLYIVLFITSIFTLLAAYQIPKLFLEYQLNQKLSTIVTALFILHPKLLSITFNGTEASLSFLMLLLSFRAYKWIANNEKLFLSTIIFGGLVLTRLDFSILLALLFIAGLMNKHSFLVWFKALLFPTFLFLTWMSINYYYFDTIMPSSGTAKKFHSVAFETDYIRVWITTYTTVLMAESAKSITAIALAIIGFILLIKKTRQIKKIALFLFIASAIAGIIPILTLGSYRDWYLIIHFIFILFVLGIAIEWLINHYYKLKKYLLIGIILLLWVEASIFSRDFNGSSTIYACQQFKNKIEENVTLGSFNSGIINCVLGNTNRVINLDGVVNNNILQFYPSKQLDKYLEENNVLYIIDNEQSIRFFLENFSKSISLEIIDRYQVKKHELILVKLKY